MLRAAFIILVLAGLAAAMLPGGGSPSVDMSETDRVLAAGGEAADFASLETPPAGALVLRREPDGHFYADTQINGATIRMLVDTGATAIALTRDDARRAGIGVSIGMPNVIGQGANGEVKGEFVTLDRVSLGGESAQAVPAVVLDGGQKSLLGQSFLSQFGSVEIKGDKMVLR